MNKTDIRVLKARRADNVICMEEKRNAYKISVIKSKAKSQLERSMYRCEDNIKIDLRETGSEDVSWIHLAQDRVQW
jgi:hypothetical protein